MASSYLDLYTTEGGIAYGGALGSSTFVKQSDYRPPTYGQNTQNMGWQAGENQRVVHDTLNNKYYGTQDKDTLTQGLTDSIARLQGQLEKGGQDVWKSNWLGHGGGFEFNNFTATQTAERNATLKSQQSYLANIGNYKQEGNQFFDSYDAYTGDYDNIYQRNYNNTQQASKNKEIAAANAIKEKENAAQREKNRLQIIENDKTAARNQKIKGEAQAGNLKNAGANAQGSGGRAKALTPNLEIGTGLLATAYRGLNNSGLTL